MGVENKELKQTKYRTTVAGAEVQGPDDQGQVLLLCDGVPQSKAQIIQALNYADYPDADGNMIQLDVEVAQQFAGMINNIDNLINQAVTSGYLEAVNE